MLVRDRGKPDIQRPAVIALSDGARTVFCCAQLQILWSIIKRLTVDVMNGFVISQQAADLPFDDKPVFSDIASTSIGMIGPVEIDVPEADSTTFKIPVFVSCFLDTVAFHERPRIATEEPFCYVRFRRKVGALSAAAFTQTVRRLAGLWDIAFLRRAPSRLMSWQEPRWMVASAWRCWPQWLSAAAFAGFCPNCVNHGLEVYHDRIR